MKKLDVIAYFGGVTKTAKALGISKSAVSLWGEEIPYGRACQVQLLTKGKLKTEQVRPS
ncbi:MULTISPECIES: Cro/CI family transcriptional regulator [Aeromonas]|jgi:DNA-binding transcriptional regulator YdaS (Cro superfamily)|uniref:Cro/CI family transcriptional regulator n=1 Tax=Aeromonas TaxID=642 RepID=UPI00067CECAB|nr:MULTISPECIES: Cro/CI family transcriptional regulator [Aeromonas]ELO1556600.1 helix-turn-helix domain-containing protein [Aeromonas hydrophila]HDT6076137.1 helix-turn-helix domain-containing protein [Aeromonas veronii bv. veronii]AUZ81306.1 Cro/Cl family transcriptional regulator [Aeromonas sp. ASNIH1]MCJ7931003.1 Cro/CI family transcriptional regulator [Aeromonas sp. LsrichE-8G]MEA9425211.1 Cro/CI family transcriptional regulator [Aeromonas caviae]